MSADSKALWSRGLSAVLVAQFLSAMADNALLFGALALLRNHHYAAWTAPLLQEFFVAAFILLAPFVGPFSDALPKGTVMLLANGVKFAGCLGMCLGANPFLMYGIVGVGAAAYLRRMLLMVGLYAVTDRAGVSIGALWIYRLRSPGGARGDARTCAAGDPMKPDAPSAAQRTTAIPELWRSTFVSVYPRLALGTDGSVLRRD